jgi:hypothetical protein
MPNIKLSKNYQAILSDRGKHIMKGLIELSCDERFWMDSSSEEVVERTLDILGSKRGAELAPKGCTSHTHRKVEGFLLAFFGERGVQLLPLNKGEEGIFRYSL